MRALVVWAMVSGCGSASPEEAVAVQPATEIEVVWDESRPVSRVTVDCAEEPTDLDEVFHPERVDRRRVYEEVRDGNEIGSPLKIRADVPVGWICEVKLHQRRAPAGRTSDSEQFVKL